LARSYDSTYYQKNGRWHFEIILLIEGKVGASRSVFKSEAENPQGYATKEEATKAAYVHIPKIPAN
jgi:hypothetical protein